MADFPGFTTIVPGMTIGSASYLSETYNAALGTLGSGTWPAQNLALYIPFRVESPVTVVKITWTNGATVNGNLDVGIYDRYGNLLVNKGSTAQSGTSAIQTADITDTLLNPGNYFMALCSNSATATFQRWSNPSAVYLRGCGVQQEDRGASAPTLATTATFANPANAYLPGMVLDCNVTA